MPVYGRKGAGAKGVSGSRVAHCASSQGGLPQSDDSIGRGRSQSASVGEDETLSFVLPIEHPFMPTLPQPQGELFFECTFFLYSVLALFLQHLNLYKSLWWLPNYHSGYTLKFYLLNPYLVSCIGLILGRRVTWCFLKTISFSLLPGLEDPPKAVLALEWLLKLPVLGAVFASFLFSTFQVISSYPTSSLSYLTYPFFLYVLLFRRELAWILCSPSILVGVQRWWFCMHMSGFSPIGGPGIAHACSLSPFQIREEVEVLQADFYLKIRHGMFSAFCTAYYAVFIPCAFAPGALFVDLWWGIELFVVVFLTSLALHLSCLMPLSYCDLLHRSAVHLGSWQKVEGLRQPHAMHMPYITWAEGSLCKDGDVVKHGRSLYRGEGKSIAAEPGNADHSKFYFIFNDSVRVLNTLCCVDTGLILLQFVMLVHSSEWQHMVTLVLLMFANYVMLFKLFKDKIILGRIYHPSPEDEQL